ncbi:hypothetical protein [Salinicola aestuarinus]|uniref:hypothetical protein n=1 Tax=Salinicola aestuarinus TaxID=1949082 RepID=UPI000DA1912E|nr:hypothetical protein [Salinicola aestuarinus]
MMSRKYRSLSLLWLAATTLGGCVSVTPHFSATNYLRDSRACERQTHQIAGEEEFQLCMSRMGWPDSQTQAARIELENRQQDADENLFDDALNGLQFGLQWQLSPQ